MKFCPKCNSRLISNECRNWKCTEGRVTEKRKPNSSWNFLNAKTKPCLKGCGMQIYFDEEHQSVNGKFIPLDVETREPHQCHSNHSYYEYSKISTRKITNSVSLHNNQNYDQEITNLVTEIKYFDVNNIPSKVISENPIIEEILNGHKEKTLGVIYYDNLVSLEPKKIPVENLQDVLSSRILDGIKKYGLKDGFLPFQIDAIRNILAEKNTIISAPTGSGKTEAFIIPILQKILANYSTGVFALLTYPLNALIDDQVSKINFIIEKCGMSDSVVARAIHRGISQKARQNIIDETSKKCVLLATSFDFIDWHLTLQTNNWKILCKPAKIMVIDEAHSYTSFHGSNVYHVIRRMRKYMCDLQYVCSSATLDNPEHFFSEMFDLNKESFKTVKSSTSRKRDIHRIFIMPRKFPQRETIEMLTVLCHKNKAKQLIFSNTVSDAEILAVNLREQINDIKVKVHSGVIEKEDRKIAEGEMKQGDLDVLSCTPTMDLGVDIGQVNTVISAFTGEYDKFVQRIGRAGRRGQKSYAICVFEPRDAVCHYYANNIYEYLAQEHKVEINKSNLIILEKHKTSEELEDKASHTFDKKPLWDYANNMNLRGTSGTVKIFIADKSQVEKNIPTAYYQLHQKALYRLNSVLYEVDKFEKTKDGGKAFLKHCNVVDKNKKTFPIVKTNLKRIDKISERKPSLTNEFQIVLVYGLINLEKTITGYLKGNKNDNIRSLTKINGLSHFNWEDLCWNSKHSSVEIHIALESYKHDLSNDHDVLIHTITHVFVNASKIVTKSDTGDIDAHFEDNVLYLYDNTANGANGCSKIIYDRFEDVLEKAYSLLSTCTCKTGCPKCIHVTGFCHTNNLDLEKQMTLEFFKKLLLKK